MILSWNPVKGGHKTFHNYSRNLNSKLLWNAGVGVGVVRVVVVVVVVGGGGGGGGWGGGGGGSELGRVIMKQCSLLMFVLHTISQANVITKWSSFQFIWNIYKVNRNIAIGIKLGILQPLFLHLSIRINFTYDSTYSKFRIQIFQTGFQISREQWIIS